MNLLVWISILLFPYFQKGDVMICVSGTAYSYHKTKCQGLRECTHEIKWITIKDAIDRNRKPCCYCYPGDCNDKPLKEQCNATTKKGTRCSRSARSEGYCYQHGG